MEILDLIEDYELHTKRLERVNNLIKELCLQIIKYIDRLLEIKGIEITTVASFIVKMGDIMRFNNTNASGIFCSRLPYPWWERTGNSDRPTSITPPGISIR